jgi:tRNA nucleotidyltransferase/poly(A) polymerase
MNKILIFRELNELFSSKGTEIGLVGGAVRDLLMFYPINDIDILIMNK